MASEESIRGFLNYNACAVGQKCTLVLISVVKRFLEQEIPASFRLKFLEHLDKMTAGNDWLTADMIAAIEPVCDAGYEIVREAQSLGAKKAIDIHAEVFPTFALLNPSLMNVLKQSHSHTARSA